MIKKILLILGHKTLMTDAYGIKKRNKKTYIDKRSVSLDSCYLKSPNFKKHTRV